jgi:hypothetical protein
LLFHMRVYFSHQQVYFTNLSATNARDSPEFVQFYAAKAYYGIDDLSPSRF